MFPESFTPRKPADLLLSRTLEHPSWKGAQERCFSCHLNNKRNCTTKESAPLYTNKPLPNLVEPRPQIVS